MSVASDTDTIEILYVEDDTIDQMSFQDFIEEKKLPYNITFVNSVHQAMKAISKTSGKVFDVIMVDYLLHDGSAFDVIEKVNMNATPIIFITGKGDEEVAVKAMKAGVFDYLVKDFKHEYLHEIPILIDSILSLKLFDKKLEAASGFFQKPPKTLTEIDILNFHIDRTGPRLTFPPYIETSANYSDHDLLKMGNFFYLAIGQGSNRNFGLYELPTPGYPKTQAYIYAYELEDPNNPDPRNQGKNYCLLTFLIPTDERDLLPHSIVLEEKIKVCLEKYIFSQNKTLDDLKTEKIPETVFKEIFE